MWGGDLGVKKILWVMWLDICKPKNGGGLGVRDLRVVNVFLLRKWRSMAHFHQVSISPFASV